MEVADDPGEGGADDGLVQGAEEDRGHDPEEGDHAAVDPVVLLERLFGCLAGRQSLALDVLDRGVRHLSSSCRLTHRRRRAAVSSSGDEAATAPRRSAFAW